MENENIVNAEVTNNGQESLAQSTEGTKEAQGQAEGSATAIKSDEINGEGNLVQSTENKPKQDSATNRAFQTMRKEHEKALREAQKQEIPSWGILNRKLQIMQFSALNTTYRNLPQCQLKLQSGKTDPDIQTGSVILVIEF